MHCRPAAAVLGQARSAANAFEFMHAVAAAGASIPGAATAYDDRIIETRTHSGVWSGVAVPVMYHTRDIKPAARLPSAQQAHVHFPT